MTNANPEGVLVEPTFPAGAAIVVGGSGGLGRAISLLLGASGCPVVIGYHRQQAEAQALERAIFESGGRARAVRLDVLDEESVDHVVADATAFGGGIASMVYAAGTRKAFDFVGRIPDETWERALTMDVRGFLAVARHCLPPLRKSSGSIVSLTTYQGARIEPRGALSSVPKAAVERATLAIAREEGRYGVRANAVRAGWIEAGSASDLLSEEMRARKLKDIPLGRLGSASDVANLVRFLLSRDASFITGAAIPVDGGESL